MTYHTDEIHQLIADIDHLLSHSAKGISKFLSNQRQQEKEVLQRVRSFLVQLEEDEVSKNDVLPETTKSSATPAFSSLLTQFNQQNLPSVLESSGHPPETISSETAQTREQITALLQPLQAELSRLLAERADLLQEIRQLEQKRLQNSLLSQQLADQEGMISDFLEVLMGRLVPHLKSNSGLILNANVQNLDAITSGIQPILESAERVEQLANLARNLDQRLLSLDGTVNSIFEALERNINAYYHSLSQALAKMHDQGIQGEQLMANFLNNLTQYLQQQVLINESAISSVVNPQIVSASLSLAESSVVEESKTSEDISLESSGAEILPINLATELLENQSQSAKDLQLTNTDEVDELYASFFNTEISSSLNFSFSPDLTFRKYENLAIASEDISNDLSVLEINGSTVSSIADSAVLAEPKDDDKNYEPQTIISPAPTEVKVPLSPEEKEIVEQIQKEPDPVDTITVLTDLLVDTGNEIVPLEFINQLDNADRETENQQLALSNFVAASAEENLLSVLDNDVSEIPEIVLDAKQLQQLDQDLATFDQQLNYAGESITKLDATSQVDSVNIVSDQEVDLSLTTQTNVEGEPEYFTQSPLTEGQFPTTNNQTSIHHEEEKELIPGDTLEATWYLGIDIGTTGISAALLNRSQLIVYPIYWSAESQVDGSNFQQSFRLPAEVYLPTNSGSHQGKSGESDFSPHLYSAQLKPYLQIAVPYQQERQKWEPMLQLNEFSAGPLIWVVRSLSKLLSTLRSSQTSTTPALIANAVGMSTAAFSGIIKNIAGVICTCPSSWTEQYRFNVREAIVTSELVSHPQQILFVEEAIASLLPELDSANGQSIQISENQGLRPLKTSDYPLLGNTLAINIGATQVEMTLVDIPANLEKLTHKDFILHNFPYSGKGIEQDIICQLLLPPKSRQPRQPGQSHPEPTNTNPWHWQPSIPGLDQMQFSDLGLEALSLPKVGEPDTEARIRLQQRLESSLLGQALLDAALALKLILQHQETFTLEFADQRWVLQRRDLESQVFVPFVRRLNRELNKLLVVRGIPTEAINQAVLSGGVASVGTINRWLRQKLPNAKIIQDLYLGENGTPNCSRVALGLTMLPLHPQVLDIPKQQYTDYFLFSELLKLLPNRSLSFGEVLQLFESRGINTRICQQRLLAFLEGELPPGLIPATSDHLWLTHHSQENLDYKAIDALKIGINSPPLFEKQGNLSYRPNLQQVQLLLRHLATIKSSTVQSLEEPYSYLL
ncbi:hypothetical protein IQ226_08700 [Dolichospermum sp. LEGE 00240]|uniref:hypothetical protein n=1 Tax=Dolichospermum sp. LEGE 00240 TaxID=1828603 RepID=UPI001882F845|nr:hypothetical protein [Dolichospermum sp. LEGE 00240]MDM3844352.1 hypothetical protein [Aphanizomenon gracile PMC638.10]MDM3851843.1 hypothetical protein [Aphanizomenon gracile PMC627.10]MDM3853794.1 hypothetical protein [Aphanizomenon gracile PMC649.10]MDM3861593.1 hypothetical protein [Aphanizomenon gracile PMC644.10]